VRCWHGYLSGAGCRLAYGPANATATHCLGKSAIKRVCVIGAVRQTAPITTLPENQSKAATKTFAPKELPQRGTPHIEPE